jgi:hypothetical protein
MRITSLHVIKLKIIYNNTVLMDDVYGRSLSQPRKDSSDSGLRRGPLIPTSLMAVQHR